MKVYILITVTLLSLTGCNNYSDQLKEAPVITGNTEAGKSVYETYSCAACHGNDGQTSALGVSRIIADIDDKRDIENALYALQSLTSDRHEAMKSVAAGLNSQEIVDVAAYIADAL